MLGGRVNVMARARPSAFGAPVLHRSPGVGSSRLKSPLVVRASVFERFSERSIRVLMLSQQHGKELGSAEVRVGCSWARAQGDVDLQTDKGRGATARAAGADADADPLSQMTPVSPRLLLLPTNNTRR